MLDLKMRPSDDEADVAPVAVREQGVHYFEIRQAEQRDLDALVRASKQERYCVDRLKRQADGLGVLLVLWHKERPVGWVFLWTAPAEEGDLQEHLSDVPLITHLEIFKPRLRNQGFGTELIKRAERELAERHGRVALAVEESNRAAERLYRRLGYREWDRQELLVCRHREWRPNGTVVEYDEKCYVMVKKLTRTASGQIADGCVQAAVV